jgi:predicted aspartyl protease
MEIEFKRNLPFVQVGLLEKSGAYQELKFLVDTGFNGTLIFATDQDQFLNLFEITDLQMLPKESWVKIADGRKVQTQKAKAIIRLRNNIVEESSILLIHSYDRPSAILGIDFMRQNQKQLLLDFREERFSLK